ncbi:hypothetical protein QBC47DRAFT_202307 [Echria macrotheca]|uniref:Secreted protein n=1 Tax=Echria macrotheca TaxID=438768 RepID=A0AAJ0F5S3_9PEZI|nr:hypothetical protein QBC47DRAFT_202307 [Echria macrotheca]
MRPVLGLLCMIVASRGSGSARCVGTWRLFFSTTTTKTRGERVGVDSLNRWPACPLPFTEPKLRDPTCFFPGGACLATFAVCRVYGIPSLPQHSSARAKPHTLRPERGEGWSMPSLASFSPGLVSGRKHCGLFGIHWNGSGDLRYFFALERIRVIAKESRDQAFSFSGQLTFQVNPRLPALTRLGQGATPSQPSQVPPGPRGVAGVGYGEAGCGSVAFPSPSFIAFFPHARPSRAWQAALDIKQHVRLVRMLSSAGQTDDATSRKLVVRKNSDAGNPVCQFSIYPRLADEDMSREEQAQTKSASC